MSRVRLSDMLRSSPEVRALVEGEARKFATELDRDTDAWQSYIAAATALTTRMVISGNWTSMEDRRVGFRVTDTTTKDET